MTESPPMAPEVKSDVPFESLSQPFEESAAENGIWFELPLGDTISLVRQDGAKSFPAIRPSALTLRSRGGRSDSAGRVAWVSPTPEAMA
jgi:hypothetical protein